jgi:hypothetical protein
MGCGDSPALRGAHTSPRQAAAEGSRAAEADRVNVARRTASAVNARVDALLSNGKRAPVPQVKQCDCCLKYVAALSDRRWCAACEKEFRPLIHRIEVAR